MLKLREFGQLVVLEYILGLFVCLDPLNQIV